jgi:hypothetical protein
VLKIFHDTPVAEKEFVLDGSCVNSAHFTQKSSAYWVIVYRSRSDPTTCFVCLKFQGDGGKDAPAFEALVISSSEGGMTYEAALGDITSEEIWKNIQCQVSFDSTAISPTLVFNIRILTTSFHGEVVIVGDDLCSI